MKKIADTCQVCGGHFHGSFKKDSNIMYLCAKHLHHMKRYGRIIERTRYDKNDIEKHGDDYVMSLYDRAGNVIATTLIDANCIGVIRNHKWSALKKGGSLYVKTDIIVGGKRRTLYLAALVLGSVSGYQVDHISGDTLDNRRENLRLVTQQQNLMNKTKAKGVWMDKRDKRWTAYIGVKNKRITLGRFATKEEALNARWAAELEYYGEFAPKRNNDIKI